MSWYDEDSDEPGCQVVVNHEAQYALWPADRRPPRGWTETGVRGTPRQCAEYVSHVWTDMRPLSVRRAMRGSGEADAAIGHARPDGLDSPSSASSEAASSEAASSEAAPSEAAPS
jgi:MbtH protein